MKLKDARSLTQEAQEALRLRVMAALEAGMRQTEAARVFGVSRAAVALWVKRRREGGLKALAAGKRGRPAAPSRLLGGQAAQVVRAITDTTPDQLKLPFVLWTRAAVARLIEERFGVTVSLMTVGRWLKRWGLTPQKPKRRAWEQNPEAVGRCAED